MKKLFSVRSWPEDVIVFVALGGGVAVVTVAMLVMVVSFAYRA